MSIPNREVEGFGNVRGSSGNGVICRDRQIPAVFFKVTTHVLNNLKK